MCIRDRVIVLAIPAIFILSLVKLFTTKQKAWLVGVIIPGTLGLGIVALFVTAFLSGYNTYNKKIKNANGKGVKTQIVTTEDGLLELKVPKTWRTLDQISGIGSLGFGNLRSEQYLIVISEPISDFEDSFTLDDYAEICLGNTKDSASEYTSGQWVPSQISGYPAKEIEVNAVIDRLKIKYLNGYLETETHYHQIMQWTLPSQWKNSEQVFRSVLDSAKPPLAIAESK